MGGVGGAGGGAADRLTTATTGETVWETPLGFIYKQDAAFYYCDGRDTGDTTLVRIPTSTRPPDDYIWDDEPPPDTS
ncbi:MAG: hypothetical protein QOJ03_37 [Frankiaceae bacterium]|nr:hypothetical protein [Frankiaceae bacterium]